MTEALEDIQWRMVLVRGFNTSHEECSAVRAVAKVGAGQSFRDLGSRKISFFFLV